MISPVCRAPLAERLCSVRSTSLTLLRCTPNIRARTFWGGGASTHVGRTSVPTGTTRHPRGRGFVATQKRAGDARATLRPSWRSETERGRARMSLLTWTVSDGGVHHADFGGGRYSVARTHGRVPRFVARWHRSRVRLPRVRTSRRADDRSRQGCLRAARTAAG